MPDSEMNTSLFEKASRIESAGVFASETVESRLPARSSTSKQNGAQEAATDTSKRKNEEKDVAMSAADSGNKRPRRSDQARDVSCHMDSMATLSTPVSTKATTQTETAIDGKDGVDKPATSPIEIVSRHVELTPVPGKPDVLPNLSKTEIKELERYLDLSKEDSWRDDWVGNLAFADKEILNPDGKSRERSKKALFRWAERGKLSLKLLHNLVRYVYNLTETPSQAKRILASAEPESARSVQEAVRRVCYDPNVLQQDGWTTSKSKGPIGASGGPFRIGEKVFWEGHEGIVIAYVHDNDIGDLWKAMWLEEFDTFDLEVEELQDAKRRFERKMKLKEQQQAAVANGGESSKNQASTTKIDHSSERRSGRNASADFNVKGIEHGIILAVSLGRGARPGVFWPARVMHFSELHGTPKRSSSKQKVDVVFLAPYWNGSSAIASSRRHESYSDSLQRHGSSIFSAGPLFEIETIDASPEYIQEYSYDPDRGIDLDELSTSFKFAGLPKAAFSRFVESHRLALALKTYSQKVMLSTAATEIDKATASLFEAHPLAGQTVCLPEAVLHLPFAFILSQLPEAESRSAQQSYSEPKEEPALKLGVILEAMKPPMCWGEGDSVKLYVDTSPPEAMTLSRPFASPPVALNFGSKDENGKITVDRFLVDLRSLSALLKNEDESMSALLIQNLRQLLGKVPEASEELDALSPETKKERLKALVKLWIVVKTHGEELISSSTTSDSVSCLLDWRRACERIYKYITIAFSSEGFGNGVSWVVSDSVCNLHVTSNECFERAVRLPAAVKAARQVAAEKGCRIQMHYGVRQKYLNMAEKEVARRAHSQTYLARMKKKCQSVANQGDIVALTEDSEGNGGADTKGSQGSWKAAIAAVGASIQAVDMIMNGECVNVFCLTRPPGHHAGRELHAMKAVSNGFCLLNNAACAALYATAPVSEGGPGLRRVCVIDIDVHHGNGTQDILCSTYDPRFLYVSIHAGGADVNGIEPSVEDGEQFSHHLARNPKKGIFPGRCGDTSPHQGVLNIPLGGKVTAHALGAALITKVTPAVEKFSPELIIVSTGFDAHKNDPLGLGGLNAEDFGTLTEVICKLAHKSCSGRVLSVLEGGYGVPCCRLPTKLFDPEKARENEVHNSLEKGNTNTDAASGKPGNQPPPQPKEPMPDGMMGKEATNDPLASKLSPENGTGTDSLPNMEPKTEEPFKVADQAQNTDPPPKPLDILDLGGDLPENMNDDMSYALMKRLDKCHAEGFMDCVREHVSTLGKCNFRN